MAQKYHSMKEASDVLGISPDEVKKLMEQRKLYGYRDGADWKFKSEDIEKLAREREMESSAAGDDAADVLLSEVALGQSGPGASGTVIGMEGGKKKAAEESDLRLADSAAPASGAKKAPAAKGAQFDELDLTLDDDLTLHDSKVGAGKGKAGDSAVDLSGKKLDEDELVLGGSGTGSDVTIGGDSGISLVDPADSGLSLEDPIELGVGTDESLELGEAEMIAVEGGSGAARGKKGDDDFLLTPLEEAGDADDSESGSQVIALDTEEGEMIGAGAGPSMAAMLDEDVSGGGMMGMAGMGMAGAAGLGMGAMAGAMGAPMPDAEATLPEKPYTAWNIVALVACTLFLTFCGWFMYDVLRNMWSWDAPYTVSSPMMDTIIGWFEK
jgi:excisionase family DNA binding protein